MLNEGAALCVLKGLKARRSSKSFTHCFAKFMLNPKSYTAAAVFYGGKRSMCCLCYKIQLVLHQVHACSGTLSLSPNRTGRQKELHQLHTGSPLAVGVTRCNCPRLFPLIYSLHLRCESRTGPVLLCSEHPFCPWVHTYVRRCNQTRA